MGPDGPAQPVCYLEWGRRGAAAAAGRRDVVVVVDVLSFSTAAVTALREHVTVYPCTGQAEAQRCASAYSAEISVRREQVPDSGRFSLSPASFRGASGARVALASPNGATCCRLAAAAPALLVACLLNAAAAGRAARTLARRTGCGVTVLACGERWEEPSEEGALRFALEDYLGAGAVISAVDLDLTAEAAVCRDAYRAGRDDLVSLLLRCDSGVELEMRGWRGDVLAAACLDTTDIVPRLYGDRLAPLAPGET